MNIQFKNEFKHLNAEEIKDIVNRCAGQDVLQIDIKKNIHLSVPNVAYFIKYIEDGRYGFWNVEWSYKKGNNLMGSGFFENRIKITPFKVEFENNSSIFNPYSKPNNRKQLEDYLHIYINKKCPSYKQAIIEKTQEFLKKLDFGNDKHNGDLIQ